MDNNRFTIGLLIVIVGVVLLLGKLGVIGFLFGTFWPLLLLAAGLGLHWLFFAKNMPAALLIPGGILSTYAVMFLLCTVFTWKLMAFLWPGFIFGVAVGLYEYYLYDRYQPRPVLLTALILAGLSGVFFCMTLLFTIGIYVIAALFIAAGLYLLLGRSRSRW